MPKKASEHDHDAAEVQPETGAPAASGGIDEAMEAGLQRFGEGHPAEAFSSGTDDEPAADEPEGAGDPGDGEPGDQAPPADEDDDPAALREKLSQQEQELDQLRAKDAAARAAEENRAFEDQVREFSREKNQAALQQIDDLDPDDFDDEAAYNARVAEIWADKDVQVATFMRSGSPVRREAPAAPPAKKAGEEGPAAKKAGEGDDPSATWDDVVAMVADKDPAFDSTDPAFLSFCRQAPQADEAGAPLPFAQQVDWALDQTRQYHQKLVRGKAAERSTEHQRRNQPMGRGGTPAAGRATGGDAKAQPVTLNEAIQGALESRRL